MTNHLNLLKYRLYFHLIVIETKTFTHTKEEHRKLVMGREIEEEI